MSRLREPFVQQKAIQHLHNYYKEIYSPEKLYVKDEVKTVKKLRGRADGFLCFHSAKQKFHSISIEAKSHTTLSNIFPFMDGISLDGDIAVISIFLAITSSYFIWDFSWYWILLYIFVVAFLTIIAFIIVTEKIELKWYKSSDVVNQVMRYPANEKWVAISRDSINLLQKKNGYVKGNNFDEFTALCRRKGVGLIVVNHLEPQIFIKPKFKKGRFLKNYKKHKEIEAFLT